MRTHSNEHFSKDQIWNDYDKSGSIIDKKIPWVLKNIPSDIKTIIDVGCGNGLITNVLSDNYHVVGVDMSETALKQVKCQTIRCSSDRIPVESQSHEMVFSSQLLEHLNNKQLQDTVKEFKRIAQKYILITVPNQEFLKICEARCPECTTVFNTNGHYQSFSLAKLNSLFSSNFEMINHSFGGSVHQEYNHTLMDIRQNYGKRFFNPVKYTMCPNCKNDNFPHIKGNIISKVCNGINRIISHQSPYWILILYKRTKA